MDWKWMDAADVAKRLRGTLKAQFPGVKFTVRTSKYSLGASIRVGWTDGPLLSEVNALTQPYAGCTFDGMIDLEESKGPRDVLDGAHSGAHYVFCEREYSDALWQQHADPIAKATGTECPPRSNAHNVYMDRGNGVGMYFDAMVGQYIERRGPQPDFYDQWAA